MTDLTPSPRRYSDEEVRKLLERATELQRTEPSRTDPSGLTLDELESIAREAGIDVDAVRRAAMELDTGVQPAPRWTRRLMGEPAQVILERALPGEASREALEELVPLIQSVAEVVGRVTVAGRTLTWQARDPTSLRDLNVVVSVRSGETRVRVQESYGNLAGAIFGSGVGGIGGGVGLGVGIGVGAAIGSAIMMIGFPLAAFGLTYAGSRMIYAGIVGRRRQALERLLMELVDALAADTTGRELPAVERPALGDGSGEGAAARNRGPQAGEEPGVEEDPDSAL